jgi:hypothetical protein
MSAIREVKYLRELKHQNIIEVCLDAFNLCNVHNKPHSVAPRCFLIENESEPRP